MCELFLQASSTADASGRKKGNMSINLILYGFMEEIFLLIFLLAIASQKFNKFQHLERVLGVRRQGVYGISRELHGKRENVRSVKLTLRCRFQHVLRVKL